MRPKELTFIVEGGDLVVCEVSEFAGVRLGAKLNGYREIGGDGFACGKLTKIPAKGFKGRVGVEALAAQLGIDGHHALIFDMPINYHTKVLDMDAKEFGLPQTRTRKYMFIWRPDQFPDADIADLWTELVDFLRVPLKYSIDSFLLSDENDRVHRFRDALQGPLGRLTARERQAGDWWVENANADTGHAKTYRAGVKGKGKGSHMLHSAFEVKARPFTNWGPNGKFTLASANWWPEGIAVCQQRKLDLLDCFCARAAEVGKDALHHLFWWNISQNVGRTSVIDRPGITSCITPGGESFGPHIGRLVLGYEKLLLSGIPADKLVLGTETEVQLSDLAGNAMAMPVVSAAILAAMLVPVYARCKEADANFSVETMAKGQASSSGTSKAEPEKASKGGKKASAGDEVQLLDRLHELMPLCATAERTSVLCTCETSGGVSKAGIVQCSDCMLTLCRSCGFRVDLRTHEAGNPCEHACCKDERGNPFVRRDGQTPAEFEQTLRSTAPPPLSLDAASAAQLSERGVELPANSEYFLTRVVRERGGWMLGYSTCDPKTGSPLAELRITIGRLGRGRGLSALLFSFAAALRGERGRMPPVARMLLTEGSAGKKPAGKQVASCTWEVPAEPMVCELSLSALSRVPSYRSELGLIEYKSEEWPDELRIDGDGTVAGVYERQRCRWSCVFGALWKRRKTAGHPTLWMFVRPTVDRTAQDELVISKSPLYKDSDTHAVLEVPFKADAEPEEEDEEPTKGKKKKPKPKPKAKKGDENTAQAVELLCAICTDGKKPAKKAKTSNGASTSTKSGRQRAPEGMGAD